MYYDTHNGVPYAETYKQIAAVEQKLGVLHSDLHNDIELDRRGGRLSAAGDKFAILKAATEVYRKALAAVQEGREYRVWK